ncbi:protein FAR1-RELATED SEQUENCE 2 isoform X2 [Tripterygium wilfordii]|uniref:protein FAR1-RELATED SEQUENCE 2 isoform X2 n=1 Tax=Tripterygium wilfordii TaxID=458696 RepID=UPI0018F82D60|nr:protein FAR1-RELATED SEQUENCE 2 isoform X2 [Tripterygium wilfordii]
MEIDLELPSHEELKLPSRSNTNVEIVDEVDGMQVVSQDINSTRKDHVEETCGLDANGSLRVVHEQVDVNAVGADVTSNSATCDPQNGLEFETKEAAYSFYREYARSVGFGITIKASRRSKRSGKFIDVKIACSRFGSKRDSSTTINSRSCVKTDCKAGMHMKRTQDEKWVINSFIKEHNHEICPDDFYVSIRGHNKQPGIVACQKKGLQLALDVQDIHAMLEHFMCMQDENPNFFYAMDLDHDKRLRNVFWVDAKARRDYSSFCDVVFFNTFYVKNKFRVPFAPVIGVNHHYQFMLLGCALIGNETAATFAWLMRTWLKAVGGRAPKVIITDQDKDLNEAVADIFPDSRHCYCLWHILSKITENFGFTRDQEDCFMENFDKCLYRSLIDEQFEKRWWKMVDKFKLREREWVHLLYEDRKKWVPTYMQETFLAGISTTRRSESVASFFDKYISKEATVKEFIEQYEKFLLDRYDMESQADFETQTRKPALRSLSAFEKQMSTVYTDTIFKKFQVEVAGIVSCNLQKESEDGTNKIFRVDDFEKRQNVFVAWNEAEFNICCSCRSFEFRGFLCKHAILVLQTSGVSSIPSRYVLKRWTKDAKVRQTGSELSNKHPYRAERFNDLCKLAIKLGEEGSLSQEAYNIAFQALEAVFKNCVGVNNSVRSVSEPKSLGLHGFLDVGRGNCGNDVANSSKKKKKYKKRKIYSEPQGVTIGLQDHCRSTEQLNSRAHIMENSRVPHQQNVQGMELGSRLPTLEGYSGPEQNIHGMGQFNSIFPIRNNYINNQQGMQGLLQGQLGFRPPTMLGCFDVQESLQDMEHSAGTEYNSSVLKPHDKHLH